MKDLLLSYRFVMPDGRQHAYRLAFDPVSFELRRPDEADAPFWTALAFEQCAGCPLAVAESACCPAALALSGVMQGFADIISYTEIEVTVETDERSVNARVPAQQGLASLVGLIMSTSGCPRTAVFRPMARFHLPFSSEAETGYRAASMFLLAQHFRAQNDSAATPALARLDSIYEDVHQVNRGMAQRLRAASREDAVVNAVVLLDAYTTLLPAAIHSLLEELRPTFAALLEATGR